MGWNLSREPGTRRGPDVGVPPSAGSESLERTPGFFERPPGGRALAPEIHRDLRLSDPTSLRTLNQRVWSAMEDVQGHTKVASLVISPVVERCSGELHVTNNLGIVELCGWPR